MLTGLKISPTRNFLVSKRKIVISAEKAIRHHLNNMRKVNIAKKGTGDTVLLSKDTRSL